MDRKIKKKKWTAKRIISILFGVLFLSFIVYTFGFSDRRSKLNIDANKATISTVKRGEFTEYIPQTGIVIPSRTVYLDAIEGGTIKILAVESGAMVRKGDIIIELTNLNRELGVLTQEANLNESINRVRQTRLQLAQNDLNQQQILAEIDYQISILRPQFGREKELHGKNLISKQQFERTEEQYKYNMKRRKFTYLAYKNDSIDRVRQLRELDRSENRMMESLHGVAKILDNLIVRAPFAGQLTMPPQMDIGQSVTPGQRLGQVDVVGSFIVRCPIDEIYLNRINTGLIATYKDYKLRIKYIYPNINNGRFEVDMEFVDKIPEGIVRGQSFRLRIALGKSSEQLLLPVGGFYKDTGGNWAFVLSEDGKMAERRPIRVGRRNTEYYEVTSGLQPDDRVITSSYDNYGDNEVLILQY
ncbi:MAG: efflux transporter periplasmic adaptor subunit [Bacteroidetes bacterium]|nr:efflux transporter periplasmic adaptor subunit [Bacteroidota bacterium]